MFWSVIDNIIFIIYYIIIKEKHKPLDKDNNYKLSRFNINNNINIAPAIYIVNK